MIDRARNYNAIRITTRRIAWYVSYSVFITDNSSLAQKKILLQKEMGGSCLDEFCIPCSSSLVIFCFLATFNSLIIKTLLRVESPRHNGGGGQTRSNLCIPAPAVTNIFLCKNSAKLCTKKKMLKYLRFFKPGFSFPFTARERPK